MFCCWLALLIAIRPSPWYDPRYALAMLGIVLGSVLNSASLGLDKFFGAIVQGRAEIEAQLALGAPWREVLAQRIRNSVRRGMIPITNQMAGAGITLSDKMTGQILAGMDPLDAAKYQILGGNGVLIVETTPNSSAARAGLRSTHVARDGTVIVGDVIQRIDGIQIDSAAAVDRVLEGRRPGDRIVVSLLRDSQVRCNHASSLFGNLNSG